MCKQKIVLFLLFFFGAAFSYKTLAFEKRMISQRTECSVNSKDPFEPMIAFDDGPNKSLCADVSTIRFPQFISESEDSIRVANFRHSRRWWTAEIPRHGIERVFFQFSIFNNISGYFGAAHGQLRFMLAQDQPIILHPQETDRPFEAVAIDDLTLTGEPFLAVHQTPTMISQFNGQAGIVNELISNEERTVDEVSLRMDRQVYQVELLLDAQQRQHLIEVVINRAQRTGYTEIYHVLNNNCLTMVLDAIDEAFPIHQPVRTGQVYLSDILRFDAVVGPMHTALEQRGLAQQHSDTSMNDETAQGNYYLPGMILSMDDSKEKQDLQTLLRGLRNSLNSP